MTTLYSADILSVLRPILEMLETAAGCRGKFRLFIQEASTSTGISDAEYLKALRDKYEEKPAPVPHWPYPVNPPLWSSAPVPLPFPGTPGVVYCCSTPASAGGAGYIDERIG